MTDLAAMWSSTQRWGEEMIRLIDQEEAMWRVVEEALSDDSIVWNVTNGETTLHCIGEHEAFTLLDAIDKCTNEKTAG